jgi:hypothetical protein
MFSGKSILSACIFLLCLSGAAFAQSNPGFVEGAPLCANYPNPACEDTAPRNPLSLNQAFMNKMDFGAGGLVGDGVTDNSAALQGLFTTAGMNGGSVLLPCGNFVVARATVLNVAAGKSVTVQGQGLCTILAFRATNATVINLGDVFTSIRWGHMRLTTDGTGTRTGLTANMSAMEPVFPTQHAFHDLQLTGDDYTLGVAGTGVHYWSTGLSLVGLSNVSIDNVTSVGTNARGGTGVRLSGASVMAPPVVINFKNFFAVHNNVGITFGAYVQGVSVVNSNFQSGSIGINTVGPGMAISQLSVVNSQFGDNTTAGIEVANDFGALSVMNSLFEMGSGQIGIFGTGVTFQIGGNTFVAESAASGIGIGIDLASPGGFGTIFSNNFTNLASGINGADAYASVMITHNMHAGTMTPYLLPGGTGVRIIDIQPIGVATLPPCGAVIQGSSFIVTDNNTAVSYRGAVTAGGSTWSQVFCLPSGVWVQN